MFSGFVHSTKFLNMLPFEHFTILADMPPSVGYTRDFSYCLKITNLEKYPDYLLFVQIGSIRPDPPIPPYVVIKTGECVPVSGYRPVARVAAISKDKVQPNDLANSSLGTILQNTNLQKALIKGTPTIEPPLQLPFIYQGTQIKDSFQIHSIGSNGLQLSLVNRSPQMLNWIVFPLIGATILGWMIWRRKKQMGSSK